MAVVLVVAGVLSEVNLLRVFIGDGRKGRREERERRFSSALAVAKDRSVCTGLRPFRVAACVALFPFVAAHGQSVAPEGAPGDANSLTTDARPTLSEPRLTFTVQPQPSDQYPSAAASQPLTISTNRPTFDDTAGIVPLGHFQIETGFTFTYRDREGTETQSWNAPELLGRIPLLDDRLELQVGTSGYVWSRSDSGSGFDATAGWSDATIGLRLKVIDQDKWVPRIALQAITTVGSGTEGISNQDAEPTFKFIWSYDLGDGWGVYGNLGLAYPSTNGDRFLQGQAGVCLTKTLNEMWSVFGEYYVFGPNVKGSDAAHYIDVGAAYLITPRIQLDGRVGFGLNQEANNFFTGFGISFLF